MHDQYKTLNDASSRIPELGEGATKIWYARSGSDVDPMSWLRTIRKNKGSSFKGDLGETHTLLGTVRSEEPEKLFHALQGEMWSPNGEARGLISSLGLSHTSMSVGDAIQIGRRLLVCDMVGFIEVEVGY